MPDLLTTTDLIADFGIIFAAVAASVFVVSYAVFFNWRLTQAGRSLMYFVLALVSVAILSFLSRWLGPEYWGRELLRPLTWWAVAATAIRLTWVLWSTSSSGDSLDIESRPRKKE